MGISLGDPCLELRKAPTPTREERREVFRLSRAGHSREAIAEKTGLSLDDVLKLVGPEKVTERMDRFEPLQGTWRYFGT